MKLTVTSPCWNQRRFICAWLENILPWADAVVISEGGSTDGTVDIIAEYDHDWPGKITILAHKQTNRPHWKSWEEAERRNALAAAVREGYEVQLDVDEMLPDDFREKLEIEAEGRMATFHGLWLNFWRTPWDIRVRLPRDEHWGPVQKQIAWPAGAARWYDMGDWHARLAFRELPRVDWWGEVPKFHYHYLFAAPSAYENRAHDWKIKGRSEETVAHSQVMLERYRGPHPRALWYLEESLNFGELAETEWFSEYAPDANKPAFQRDK